MASAPPSTTSGTAAPAATGARSREEALARSVLAVLCGAVLVVSAALDLPALSRGHFWGDGATYYAMAWSLAADGDLRYEARDLERIRAEFPHGPQGVFLKRASGGLALDPSGFPFVRRVEADEGRVYYAKSFAHPALAAPLVWLLGTRGLLVLNGAALAAALLLTYGELRRDNRPATALAAAAAGILGTVAPLYVFWPQPELVNVALIAGGIAAWRRERPVLAALLLGFATYSKPTNLFLAAPLGLAPLLGPTWPARLSGLLESLRRGAVLGAVVAACYGLNALVTGEANYQGGERKTFYDRFPFESPSVTFGNSGFWMTTERLGPMVEGDPEARETRGSGPPLPAEELRQAFLHNLAYFWIGRYGGAVPYFFPVVAALAAFLLRGPRPVAGWLALVSLLVSYLFYIWLIPANWYGGGGTVGNRYFLNLLPLYAILVPPGRAGQVAAAGALGAALLTAPVYASPLQAALRPADHTRRGLLPHLPAELTMLNDLSFNTEPWRKRQPVGDTEGDAHKHWPPDPKAYWLYFPDDGTTGRTLEDGREGFWLRPGAHAEVLLRALEPVRTMTFLVKGGAGGDIVTVSVGHGSETVVAGPGRTAEAVLTPGRGVMYYDTFVYPLRLRSRGDTARPGDARAAFVHVRLTVDRRPRRR